MGHPRIRDVATLAGVAPSTVSVVLNEVEGARVGDETRRRIHAAAETLGYTPNAHARSLRTSSQRTIALVNDEIAVLPYAVGLVQGMQEACWREGVRLVILTTGVDRDREREALEYAAGQRHTGIVLASTYHYAWDIPTVPGLVLLNTEPATAGSTVPHVVPDDVGSGRLAAEELVDLGHRRIGLLAVEATLEGELRRRGFIEALSSAGVELDDDLIDTSVGHDATADGGLLAARRLLDVYPRPTAISCFNDRMAMGVYQAAAERGLRIPEDLSVVGHDNLEPIADSLHPSLTTVDQSHVEMGETAVDIALDPNHPAWSAPDHRVEIPAELVRRFSATPVDTGARMQT